MKPRSDLVLQIASTWEVAKTQAATYTGKLVELQRLSATTVRFGVEIPDKYLTEPRTARTVPYCSRRLVRMDREEGNE